MVYKCKCNYTTSSGPNMLNHFNICKELDIDDSIRNDIMHKCNYCNKKYRKTKEEHENKCSKILIQGNTDETLSLRPKIKQKNKTITTTTTTTTTTNTNTNILINNYIYYSTYYVTIDGDKNISEFSQYIFNIIFCNQEYPNNHLVYYVKNNCIFAQKGSLKNPFFSQDQYKNKGQDQYKIQDQDQDQANIRDIRDVMLNNFIISRLLEQSQDQDQIQIQDQEDQIQNQINMRNIMLNNLLTSLKNNL